MFEQGLLMLIDLTALPPACSRWRDGRDGVNPSTEMR